MRLLSAWIKPLELHYHMVRSIWRDRQVGGSSLLCASLSLLKDALIVTLSV